MHVYVFSQQPMTCDNRYHITGVLTLAQAQEVPRAALAEQQPV